MIFPFLAEYIHIHVQATVVCVDDLKYLICFFLTYIYIYPSLVADIFILKTHKSSISGRESALYCKADNIVWLFAYVLQIKFVLKCGYCVRFCVHLVQMYLLFSYLFKSLLYFFISSKY